MDTMHHRHGAPSWPGFTAIAYADTQVRRILDLETVRSLLEGAEGVARVVGPVAPTADRLLGVEMDAADGKVLDALLE